MYAGEAVGVAAALFAEFGFDLLFLHGLSAGIGAMQLLPGAGDA